MGSLQSLQIIEQWVQVEWEQPVKPFFNSCLCYGNIRFIQWNIRLYVVRLSFVKSTDE
jgi:hypothetical protein